MVDRPYTPEEVADRWRCSAKPLAPRLAARYSGRAAAAWMDTRASEVPKGSEGH